MTLWYLARATGMVTLIAFTVSTALGALATRTRTRPSARDLDRRFLTQMAHRSAAILGLLMLAGHATLIIVDSYVNVSLSGALVAFTAGYSPLAVGAGTLAVYLFVMVAVSGAMRGRLAASPTAVRAWRAVHLSAYAGWVLSMGHGIFAGTDTGAWWSSAVYAACAAAVLVAVSIRLLSADSTPIRSAPTGRTLVRSSS
jgi:sulfoxide reductase heme-binding subunit YedZ